MMWLENSKRPRVSSTVGKLYQYVQGGSERQARILKTNIKLLAQETSSGDNGMRISPLLISIGRDEHIISYYNNSIRLLVWR